MEKFTRNNRLICSDLEDNLVMMAVEKGKYFALNPVGKGIWELIDTPRYLEEIIHILLAEYEVSEILCKQEVELFFGKAIQNDLVVINRS